MQQVSVLIYPIDLDAVYTTLADSVWLPNYPKMVDVERIYVFYIAEPLRVMYIGKTWRVRERVRWHLNANTFIPGALPHMHLDVLTVKRVLNEETDTYIPIVFYEALLIRHFMPVENVYIKKTYKRALDTLTLPKRPRKH